MANYNLREVLKQLGRNILSWVKSNCVNNCVSTTTNLPLAAAQGKVLQDQITTLNSNIATKADIQKQGYDKTSIIYLQKNRSALVIFGKQSYSQTSLLFYDTRTKAIQSLVNPSSDTFTVDVLESGTVRITSKNATYSTKAAIYMD